MELGRPGLNPIMDDLRETAKQTDNCFQSIVPGIFSHAKSWCFWLVLFFLAVKCVARASDGNEIVTLGQFGELSTASTNEIHTLRLKAVVLCCDAGWHQLYLCDGNDTEYFNADDFQVLPQKGQLIEISGTVRGGGQLNNAHLTVLGSTALPQARPLQISQLAQDHGQWVEVEGRVMMGEISRGRLALLLHGHDQNCFLYVLGVPPTNNYSQYLGCQVRIRGINASKTNANDGRLVSPLLFVPGLEELTVIDSVKRRPTAQVVSISSLLNRELGSWTNDWVHINGLIAAYDPGRSLVVKDPQALSARRLFSLPKYRETSVWICGDF